MGNASRIVRCPDVALSSCGVGQAGAAGAPPPRAGALRGSCRASSPVRWRRPSTSGVRPVLPSRSSRHCESGTSAWAAGTSANSVFPPVEFTTRASA